MTENLKNAFPHLPENEIRHIRRNVYRNISEMFFESIKLLSISRQKLLKMVKFVESPDLRSFLSEPRGAILYSGHFCNFEIAGQHLSLQAPLPVITAYKTFKDKAVEDMWLRLRSRFDMQMIPNKEIPRIIINSLHEGFYIIFISDQHPTRGHPSHKVKFLGREIPFFTFPESIARKYNLPVYFAHCYRLSRGKYMTEVRLISRQPSETKVNEITEQYVKNLERAIIAHKDSWLWTHKRWKHQESAALITQSNNA